MAGLLRRTRHDDDGHVFEVIDAARLRFAGNRWISPLAKPA
jgi:hypothetical protein